MIAILFLGAAALLLLAYHTYGRFLERRLEVSDRHTTPSHLLTDGVDYVPTSTPILFGHHFSSIAGAGPIVGPVIAGLAFGWAPAMLWILVGAVFVGGVHDFTSLVVSIRHKARSIGDICRSLMSPATYYLFLVFILFTLIYVIIVFLDLTAASFAPAAYRHGSELAGPLAGQVRQGGAVASASLLYIAIAAVFGAAIYRLKARLGRASLLFVPLVFAGLWVGHRFPLAATALPEVFGSVKNFWALLLLGYCFVASILPVWVLLQPRDYLSSFLLYACLGGGAAGLLLTAWRGGAAVTYPAFVGWRDPQLGFVFPALFVTIACGAVSGFHAIVASGTSAKQLDRESAARKVGYGSMLVEGVLALLALATVMLLARGARGHPVAVFAGGIGRFVEALGLPEELGATFGMLAVSTFLLTTLDTCTRLSRFIFQELFSLRSGLAPRALSTLAVLALPALIVFREVPGPGGTLMPAWRAVWPAFGATNQLMAALALVVVYGWLRRCGRRAWYVLVPTLFMAATTLTALAQLVWLNLFKKGSVFVGGLSLLLGLLALVVMGNAVAILRGAPSAPRSLAPEPAGVEAP